MVVSLECEWQQVSSGVQDSSQYSGRMICSLDGLGSSFEFQLFQPFYQALLLYEFFSSALPAEWHQVTSGLQDFSEYSNRSQQCRSLHSLDPSSNLQFLKSFIVVFRSCSQTSSSSSSLYVSLFLQQPNMIKVFHKLLSFFYFHSVVQWNKIQLII